MQQWVVFAVPPSGLDTPEGSVTDPNAAPGWNSLFQLLRVRQLNPSSPGSVGTGVVTVRECCPSLEGKLLETETIVQETKEIVSIVTQVPSGNCSWELLEIRGFVLSAALVGSWT